MGLAALEQLLKASMGLSVASIGSAVIARAVQERLSACNLADRDVYLERVRTSGAELQALIEAVVVPETWFFRDPNAFTSLARFVHDDWLPSHRGGVLAVLSLPCSTGEEPYSIAMALVDAHLAAERFRVDAVDISNRHIGQGMRAVYGRNSFRTDNLGFRDRHFDVAADGYHVRQNVRQQVRFQQGNLFAADLLPGVGIYDVIFCRNVLIYFDRPTQERALAVLDRLLSSDGLLFVAPAETGLPGGHGLVSTKEPLAFGFRKERARTPAPARTTVGPPTPFAPRAAIAAVQRGAASAGLSPEGSDDPAADLDEATRFADQGHFVEAAACCEEHLRRSGPSATAFYLLGLVRDATGNHSQAASYYRKALYLDPNHHDTQIQLALLLEKQGEPAAAQVLRNRARRLEQKSTAS